MQALILFLFPFFLIASDLLPLDMHVVKVKSLSILDLSIDPIHSELKNFLPENCHEEIQLKWKRKECSQPIIDLSKSLNLNFIALKTNKPTQKKCHYSSYQLKYVSVNDQGDIVLPPNFRCDFRFPHEFFLLDYHALTIEQLIKLSKSIPDKFHRNVESVARRFINRVDFDDAIVQNTEIKNIYRPAPITWNSWLNVFDELVSPLTHRDRPLQLVDLEIWNFTSLKDVAHTNNKSITPGIRKNDDQVPFFEFKDPISLKEIENYTSFNLLHSTENLRWKKEDCKQRKAQPNQNCGRLYFPSSKSISHSLEKLINEVNLTIRNQKNLSDEEKFSYAISAPIQLVALHPFYDGNGRTAKWLQDYISTKMNLPYIVHYNINQDITAPKVRYFMFAKKGTLHSLVHAIKCSEGLINNKFCELI